jgi:2,3-bisphosphoglycerate-dependent phosphoglycerate mutase
VLLPESKSTCQCHSSRKFKSPTYRPKKWLIVLTVSVLSYNKTFYLSGMSDEAVMNLNLPTGIPFIFEFDADFNPVVSMKFLSDEETVLEATSKVASIGNVKK